VSTEQVVSDQCAKTNGNVDGLQFLCYDKNTGLSRWCCSCQLLIFSI